MKVVYYAATSLDGFIATVDHSVDWLDSLMIDSHGNGYSTFFAQVEGLLMGRRTYDFVYHHGSWPYEDRPTWVATHGSIKKLPGCNLQPERDPLHAIDAAKHCGMSVLWVVGGGQLVGQLIRERRLTHVDVSVMPILLGNGIPVVQALPEHVHLRQQSSRSMGQFTQVEYELDYRERATGIEHDGPGVL